MTLEYSACGGCIGLSVAAELHGVAMSNSFEDSKGAGEIRFSLIAKESLVGCNSAIKMGGRD